MRLSIPRLTIPGTDSAVYLPLTPWVNSQNNPLADRQPVNFFRRRASSFVLFTPALVLLYIVFRIYAGEFDDDYELDYDTLASLRTLYMPFQVFPEDAPPPPAPRPHSDPLPAECIDAYFAQGDPCFAPGTPKFDFVYTWVNGSDLLERQAKAVAINWYDSKDPWRPTTADTPDRLYRDHDELRHSLRSVLAAFRAHIGRIHLLTSDFPIPAAIPNLTLSASWRLSQIPQWLDLAKQTHSGWQDGEINLEIIHHAEIFRPYVGTNFNSLAIESQLGHVKGISDHFVYMNDDLYFGVPIQPATFYTHAYGIVLHLRPGLMVPPERPTPLVKGEWRGMGESNYVLSRRFGARERPYVMHEAKVVSAPILAELEAIWPEAFARSASHLFRETTGPGSPADINTLLLHAHFIVERAREALLWSWVVGKIGGIDDEWGYREEQRAWAELYTGAGEDAVVEGVLKVKSAHRRTLEEERIIQTLASSGLYSGMGETSYVFSSLDGYAYGALRDGSEFRRLTPDVSENDLPSCTIRLDECFASYSRASAIFKHIAFENPQCGDCVISALVRASGPLGISALLPPQERQLSALSAKRPGASASEATLPHLPLVPQYENGDFTLRGVMDTSSERNVRAWTLQLLQRYRYVVGSTPAVFEMLMHTSQVKEMLQRVDESTDAALLCINDDVQKGYEAAVDPLFRKWQERRWPQSAQWETQ